MIEETRSEKGISIYSLKVGSKVLIENVGYRDPEALKYELISILENKKRRFIMTGKEH